MHRNTVLFILFSALLNLAPAWADPQATVSGPDRAYFGAYDVRVSSPVDLQPRDVLDIVRNGRVVGQALVIDNAGHVLVVLPRTDMHAGDTVRLAHRASRDVFRQTAVQPAWHPNAPTVVVTGRPELNSGHITTSADPFSAVGSYASPGYGYGYGGYGYGAYGYGYGYSGVTPRVNATLRPAPPVPGEIPHPAMPSMLGTSFPSPVYHPPQPSVAQPGFHRSR